MKDPNKVCAVCKMGESKGKMFAFTQALRALGISNQHYAHSECIRLERAKQPQFKGKA